MTAVIYKADELVRLPASTVLGASPALSIEDQQLARQWGETHPYLLQLAAGFLCQARKQGKDAATAKKHYEVEERRLYEPASPVPNLWLPVRWFVWSLPIRLGLLSRRIEENSDKVKAWITGVVIVILLGFLILAVSKIPPITQIIQAILKFLGL